MEQAYKVSSKILKKRMEKERPVDLKILEKVKDSSIIIVIGSYDRVETVLDMIKVPYVLIETNEVDQIDLKPDQILIVNCPGNISNEGLIKIKQFVKQGGFLFTTDWALLNILEKIFPEFVKYNQKPTGDDCVAVQVVDKSNKFLEGLFKADEEPIWWLESSSYPIEINDKKKVKVLVTSKEMEEKYGEAPIIITFNYGDGGTILHMTSHYYLQRAELRTDRQKMSAKDYVKSEMAFSDSEAEEMENDLEGLSLGEAESAYSTTQFISNVIVEQQKKVMKRKKKKNKDK
ncbi:hypothetical protein LCGC14_0940490 [marine sediment metagenome]|uniref:Uncharacterized protein n=1 Tax=marine sediment metagenome TaxID=412755 RepID=A0A0F9NK62_9ZZZZ|nr:MAG: hypothetical protein Lokiarch_46140 [Candidatus Lokiarchaeum sp. GC14_75]HEC38649.1 hypothetical protein [bacterium]